MKRAFVFDLQETFPHLPRAPIREAVIHWVARASTPWDQAELRSQLQARLPDYPECHPQHLLQAEVQIGTEAMQPIQRSLWRGFRLTSADKRYVAQFNRDGLVFSRLQPYETWQSFVAEALRLWKIFIETAGPLEVRRLGVRFINRMPLTDTAEIGKYLDKPAKCLEPLNLPLTGFLYQSTHEVPGHPFQIKVGQTIHPPIPPQTEEFGLILDIDVGTTHPFAPDDEAVGARLELMHWLKNKAFFSLLSKRARKSFESQEP